VNVSQVSSSSGHDIMQNSLTGGTEGNATAMARFSGLGGMEVYIHEIAGRSSYQPPRSEETVLWVF